jgi:hypothetical protein
MTRHAVGTRPATATPDALGRVVPTPGCNPGAGDGGTRVHSPIRLSLGQVVGAVAVVIVIGLLWLGAALVGPWPVR